jgi:flagellar biosynthesis/type III secretory pathway chaperone
MIKENLTRQDRAMRVLQALLAEEFAHLYERDPQAVTATEFSVQELMRQLAQERTQLKTMLGGRRLKQFVADLPDEQAEDAAWLRQAHDVIDDLEQRCARQAGRNTKLVLALLDQNQDILDFLYKQVTPPTRETYSKKGVYSQRSQSGAMLRGSL